MRNVCYALLIQRMPLLSLSCKENFTFEASARELNMFKSIFLLFSNLFTALFHLFSAAQDRKETNDEIARIKNEADFLERKRQLEIKIKSSK